MSILVKIKQEQFEKIKSISLITFTYYNFNNNYWDMRKISDKQKEIKKQLNKVYAEISMERGHFCEGCGRTEGDVPLSHSHIIPRSRRGDLVCDKNNIQYLCLSMGERVGCHTKWESRQKDQLLCYHKNLEYILEVDTEYYFLITELNA